MLPTAHLSKLLPIARLALMLLPALPAGASDVDFNRDIRPILAGTCFKCHGPDEQARKGGLRLDLRDASIQPAKSGDRAIVPGQADASALIARVLNPDEDEVMPPPTAGKRTPGPPGGWKVLDRKSVV